jgi:hypothetical protein
VKFYESIQNCKWRRMKKASITITDTSIQRKTKKPPAIYAGGVKIN